MGTGDISLLATLNQTVTEDYKPFSVKVGDRLILSLFNVRVSAGENKVMAATMRVGADGTLTDTGYTAELDDISDAYYREAHVVKVEGSENLFVCAWAGVGYDGQCAVVHVNENSGAIDVVTSATAFDPAANYNFDCRIVAIKDDMYIIDSVQSDSIPHTRKLISIEVSPTTGAITLTGESLAIADADYCGGLYWIADTMLVVSHSDLSVPAKGYLKTYTVSAAGVITATGYSVQVDNGDAAGNYQDGTIVKCGDYFAVVYAKASTPKALRCKTFVVSPSTGVITYSGQSLDLAVPTSYLFGPNACYCRYDLSIERHIIAVPYMGTSVHAFMLTIFVYANGIIEAGGDAVEIYADTVNAPRAIVI